MIEHKFCLMLNNSIEQIYYERPSFSLDGRQFSCVVSSDYKITNSSILKVQVNANTPIEMMPQVEDFIEQGYVIIKKTYNLLDSRQDFQHNTWYYFLYDDGCIKSGYLKDGKIIFNELNGTVGIYNSKNNTIEIPVRYYIENGKVTIDNVDYDVVMDDKGVDKIQRLWEGFVCVVKNGNHKKWKNKTRLTFTVAHDNELPIQLIQLADQKCYIYYNNQRYDVSKKYNEKDELVLFVNGKTIGLDNNRDYVAIIDEKEDEPNPTGSYIITIGDTVCKVYFDYVPSTSGKLLFIYPDVDAMPSLISTNYFLAERNKPYDANFYVVNNKISVLGYDYDVSEVKMINFDKWREATLIDSNKQIYSITTNDYINTLLVKVNDNKFKLFSNEIDGIKNPILYDSKQMQKVTVDGVDYYKDFFIEYPSHVDDKVEVTLVDAPFVIPIKPKYRLNIIDYTEPNFFICQLDLDGFSWISDLNDKDYYSEIREDIYYNLRSYTIKYQPPLFIDDKTDEQSFHRKYDKLYGMGEIDSLPMVTIIKELHDIHVDFPISNLHGTNLFQEIWVKDKFVDKKIHELINTTVDMEKDVYYPMKEELNDDGNGTHLIDVTDIEFFLHFRTRNESWTINEDYKRSFENTVQYLNFEQTDSMLEVDEFLNTSWNVFDYYDEKEEKKAKLNVFKPQTNTIFTGNNNFYQPSDLLSFLNFGDDDVFYQKSKISKSFLRISFFDTYNPRTQSLLGTSTIFLDSGTLFGKFSNGNANIAHDIAYLQPTNWHNMSQYISVNSEPVMYNSASSVLTFDESRRLSSKITVNDKTTSTSSSEGFYSYIFRDYSYGLHERTIYAKIQFNHAGTGTVIDLFQPMTYEGDNQVLIDMSVNDNRKELKQGLPLEEIYKMMYIPIKIRYDYNYKKYCWYLPYSLSRDNNEQKIKFNLYEIKAKNHDTIPQ